jgi:MFS family permease
MSTPRCSRIGGKAPFFDHFALLIWPTAVLALALEQKASYAELLALSTGAFIAFGLFSLPVGWLADRFGRRTMLAAYFFGMAVSCFGVAASSSHVGFAVWLFLLGMFSAIYHPVGSALLALNARRLGHDLGVNGVWGNFGAAFASAVTAFLATHFGWRWAFLAPGLMLAVSGGVFLAFAPRGGGQGGAQAGAARAIVAVTRPKALLGLFAVGIVAGGLTFNIVTIALPKIVEARFDAGLSLDQIGYLTTGVFLFGALTQIGVGRLIDRLSLPTIFVGLSVLQPLGLGLAALATGPAMLLGVALAMAAIYGQVVLNDAMVARYVPPQARTRAYSVRYFLGFTASGLAAPLIATLSKASGFGLVLGVAAGFGAVIFAAGAADGRRAGAGLKEHASEFPIQPSVSCALFRDRRSVGRIQRPLSDLFRHGDHRIFPRARLRLSRGDTHGDGSYGAFACRIQGADPFR